VTRSDGGALGAGFWTYAALILLSFAGSIGHVIAATWLLLHGPHGPAYAASAFLIGALPPILLYRVVRARVSSGNLAAKLARLDLMQATLAVAVPVLHYAGLSLPRGVILGQELLLSCCGAFVFPLSRMLLTRLVAPEQAVRANAVSAAVFQIGNSVGAAQGGLVVAAAGPYLAMTINAATFLVSAAGLSLRLRGPAAAGGQGTAAATRPHAPGRRQLRALVLLTVCLLATQRLLLGLLGPIVDVDLGRSAAAQGGLQLCFTLGGVLGGALLARPLARVLPAPVIVTAGVLGAVASLVPLLTTNLLAVGTAAGLLGLVVSCWAVSQSVAQRTAGPQGEGPLLALIGLGQSGAAVLIYGASSLLLLTVDPAVVFAGLGCLLAALILGTARTALPQPRETGASAAVAADRVAG